MTRLTLLFFLLLFSCRYKYPAGLEVAGKDTVVVSPVMPTVERQDDNEEDFSDSSEYQEESFLLVKDYPLIKDSVQFIKQLRSNCHINKHTRFIDITAFMKIKLYGSAKSFYLIEYNWHGGASCEYPWKGQIIFSHSGKLIKIFNAMRFQLVTIFPNENPFLLNCISTAKGNGMHEIIRMHGDKTENVLDGFKDIRPQTYDAYEDMNINEPNEFPFQIKDINHDGYNDVSFHGIVIHDPTETGLHVKRIPVRFNFIYNARNGHFIEQKDYTKKYAYLEQWQKMPN